MMNIDKWNNRGDAFQDKGEYEEAIRCYNKALRINDCDIRVRALGSKGNALFVLDKYDEAIQCYDKALDIDERDELLWVLRGYSLQAQGKYKQAIQCYDKALRIAKKDELALHFKRVALQAQGKQNNAARLTSKRTFEDAELSESNQSPSAKKPKLDPLLSAKQKKYELKWVSNIQPLYYKNENKKNSLTIKIDKSNFFQVFAKKDKKFTPKDNRIYSSITLLFRIIKENSPDAHKYDYDIFEFPISFPDPDSEITALSPADMFGNNREKMLKDICRYNSEEEIEIKNTYQKCKRTNKFVQFDTKFRHSERALFKLLEKNETHQNLLKSFNQYIAEKHSNIKPSQIKIKIIILHLYSTRYLCNSCETAAGYFQSPKSVFLKKFRETFEAENYQLSQRNELRKLNKTKDTHYSSLPYMITHVGAIKEASGQKPHKHDAKDNIQFNLFNLKKQCKQYILQTDLNEIANNPPSNLYEIANNFQYLQFTSKDQKVLDRISFQSSQEESDDSPTVNSP